MNTIGNEIIITKTNQSDFDKVVWLFEQAIQLQGKHGYKVWPSIDKEGLKKDIESGLQYKIVNEENILCVFSIQFSDLHIWRERDRNDAIYLHRIVVNPEFKGLRHFKTVLQWTIAYARQSNKHFVRMDTWADNPQLINYYKSFGFRFIAYYLTKDTNELPMQNRNLNVALLEYKIFVH